MPQLFQRIPRVCQGTGTCGCEPVEASNTSPARRCTFLKVRGKQPFHFESIKCGVNRASRDAAPALERLLHIMQYGTTVGATLKAQDCEQYDLFESAQQFSHVYNVDVPRQDVNLVPE